MTDTTTQIYLPVTATAQMQAPVFMTAFYSKNIYSAGDRLTLISGALQYPVVIEYTAIIPVIQLTAAHSLLIAALPLRDYIAQLTEYYHTRVAEFHRCTVQVCVCRKAQPLAATGSLF